ncbi:MAG: hypothetical protein QNK04_32745 [Myxococcota bacterium]|nr:hypothetical protein [Myxococcota bacterium]
MDDSSRTQGGLICVAVFIVGVWFLMGLLQGSYWALAIPVAVLVFFVLGLTFWVGYTIATIQVEPFDESQETAAPEAPAPSAGTGSATGDESA